MLTLFWDMKGVILVHLTPYSPDLAPSDFHTFGPMKEALRGRRFSSDEEGRSNTSFVSVHLQ